MVVDEAVSRLMEVRGDDGRKPLEETRPAGDLDDLEERSEDRQIGTGDGVEDGCFSFLPLRRRDGRA